MSKEARVIPLMDQAAESHDAGITDRQLEVDGIRWALVEYGAGCRRAGWCSTPHSGLVISGAIEYEFEDGRDPLSAVAGAALVLPAEPRHRGRNQGPETARLFLIDALLDGHRE